MSQNCANCGAPNEANHRFCSVCGASLKMAAPAALAPSSTPPASPANGAEAVPASADAPGGGDVSYAVQRWETDPGLSEAAPAMEGEREPYSRYVPPAPGVHGTAAPTIPANNVPPPPFYTAGGATTRGEIPPAPAGARNDGAAYAPYVSEAVKHLEKPRSERSWLMPAVVGAGLLLVALLAVSGFLVLNGRSANAPVVSSPTSPSDAVPNASVSCQTPKVGASDEEQVREAIRLSNDEQIKGWRELDTEILKCRRTGKVLDENIQIVEKLRAENMYAVPVNQRFEILDVKITGDTAVARTVEEWTVTFYSKDSNQKVQSNGPDTLKETYYLVKSNGAWLINRLDFEPVTTGTPSPSDN